MQPSQMSMGTPFPGGPSVPDAPFQVRDPEFRLSNILPSHLPVAGGGVHFWHPNPDVSLVGGWGIEFAVNPLKWSSGQPGPEQPNPSDVIRPQANENGQLTIQH